MFDHVRKAVDDGEVLLEWDYSKVHVTLVFLAFYCLSNFVFNFCVFTLAGRGKAGTAACKWVADS